MENLTKTIKQRYGSDLTDEIIIYFMKTILRFQSSGIERLPVENCFGEPVKGFLNLAMELLTDGQPRETADLILETEYGLALQKEQVTAKTALALRLVMELTQHIHYDPDYYRYILMTGNLWGNNVFEYASRTFYPNLPEEIKERYHIHDLIRYVPAEMFRLEDY